MKNYIPGNSISSRETPAKLAEYVCNALVLGIPLDHLDEKYEAIRAITPAHVKETAKRHLHPGKLLEVVCGMEGRGSPPPVHVPKINLLIFNDNCIFDTSRPTELYGS